MIIYHYPCLDGSYSALVLILALKGIMSKLNMSIGEIKDNLMNLIFE
jgi:hypothetical protein